jgi:hypothetical protein
MTMAMAIDFAYRPTEDINDVLRCYRDPMWRICSGALYHIMIKSDVGDGQVVRFHPNSAQIDLLKKLWYRNIILKARQRGFTTMIAIMWLDHALFNADQRCGIIAQDIEAAQYIFRDKVKLAYDRLPQALRNKMPLARDSANELLFAHNNSSVRVATSMRSGTINRLHVSEFGKICAKFPDKAGEVVTGSFPAVPNDGVIIIESTAEGRDGEFYAMTERAKANRDAKVKLTPRDYRFKFVPWWDDPGYRLDDATFGITDIDNEYFDGVEASQGTLIDEAQRRWYVATRDSDFSGNAERMWQEYPSYPEEAFRVSTEGAYYSVQITQARKAGRIGAVPYAEGIPVNTFWDIGNSDGTAIWLHQKVGLAHRFIKFVEGWGEPYSYYIKALQKTEYIWGTHYLPHDAEHKRQQGAEVTSPIDMLKKLGLGGTWTVVPRVLELSHGIQLTRDAISQAWFDDTGCREGLVHLEGYRKSWNERAGCWSEHPIKNIHTEGADSFRQFAQSIDVAGIIGDPKARVINYKRKWL